MGVGGVGGGRRAISKRNWTASGEGFGRENIYSDKNIYIYIYRIIWGPVCYFLVCVEDLETPHLGYKPVLPQAECCYKHIYKQIKW